MDILFFIWMLILPPIAILSIIFVPVFWFFIVPRVARMLTWKRFSQASFHFIGDDTGYAYLVPTTEQLPEGVSKTKYGFRFLPRRKTRKKKANLDSNPSGELAKTEQEEKEELATTNYVENIALRKFVWRGMGKPIWFGYAGKVQSFNPAVMATLQQSEDGAINDGLKTCLEDLEAYVKQLPKTIIHGSRTLKNLNLRGDLLGMLKEIRTRVSFKSLTVLDPTAMKSVLPYMWTPSQMDALATTYEQIGLKRAGKQYAPLILGGALIVGLLVFGVIIMMMLQ